MSRDETPLAGCMRLASRWRWNLMLGLALFVMLAPPFLETWRYKELIESTAFALIVAGGIHAARPPRLMAAAGWLLTAILLAMIALRFMGHGAGLATPMLAITGGLGMMVLVRVFRELFAPEIHDPEHLTGAVFGYLMLSLVWALFYIQLEIWQPGSFSLPAGEDDMGGLMVYFSLVTITTLGYGDIAPAAPLARICAGLEAAQGTLYIAILIGRVVSALRLPKR